MRAVLQKVQELKYMGATFQDDGECGREAKVRVQTGWNG